MKIFSENLDYALGWMVIHSLWQAIAIALFMGIAMIVLRKRPARVRYWVANIALLGVLLTAVGTFVYYYDFSKEPGEVLFVPENEKAELAMPLGTLATIELQETAGLTWDSFRNYFNQHIPLIVTIWVLGVALFILKLLGGISYCYYLRSRLNFPADEYWLEVLEKLKNKAGVQQTVELVESALTRTPMVVGHLKPMILFPIGAINKLSPTDVEAILAHELAHVMRKDYLFNIIQSVIEALFYYHPAVWWISANIKTERENCCDDVAIALCGNSMDYAKALVVVQEMAYYPMYQPAVAFAGNRKNQLLHRVQRILNQPQNKTNVMEKLIATCALIVVMIGLSFGENSFITGKLTDTPPSVEEAILTAEQPSETAHTATFYLYFPDKVDSLKVPDDIPSGIYNYEDNVQSAQLTVRDHYVVALKVNDIDLKDEQLPNYKKLIDKILRVKAPDTAGNNTAEMSENTIGTTATIISNGTSSGQYSYTIGDVLSNQDFNTDNYQLSQIQENGTKVYANGTKILIIRTDGSKTFMHDGQSITVDPEGKVLTDNIYGFTELNRGATGVTINDPRGVTYINKGTVITYDDNGHKWTIKPEKDGIKHIEHHDNKGKFVETLTLKNGKAYINDREVNEAELRQRGWDLTGMGIQRISGYPNIKPMDRMGEYYFPDNQPAIAINDWKKQQSDLRNWQRALTQQAKDLAKQRDANIYWTVKQTLEAADNQLKESTPSVANLAQAKEKLEWVRQHLMSVERLADDEDASDLNEEITELRRDMKDLRTEIKDYNCTHNFNFRMTLIERLDKLLPTLKSNISRVNFNEIELTFLKIKDDWENGECIDYDKGSKNTGTTSIATSPSGYSYGTGRSAAEAERARLDAERKIQVAQRNKDDSKSGKAIRSVFQTLINEGYVSLGKQCNISFNHKSLIANGRRIDSDLFNRIKSNFERIVGESYSSFSVTFAGTIKNISSNHMEVNGSLGTSFNKD